MSLRAQTELMECSMRSTVVLNALRLRTRRTEHAPSLVKDVKRAPGALMVPRLSLINHDSATATRLSSGERESEANPD